MTELNRIHPLTGSHCTGVEAKREEVQEKTLIMGLGSEVLGDKSLPLRLVRDLEQGHPHTGLYYTVANTGGLDLLEHLEGFSRAMIIDTVMTGKPACGQVAVYNPGDPFPGSLHLPACSDAGSPVPLMLGRKLGLRLPSVVRIVSVGIPEWLEFSLSFSDLIGTAYPGILSELRSLAGTAVNGQVSQKYMQFNPSS